MTSDSSLPFFGVITFHKLTEEEAAKMQAELDRVEALRRAHVAERMETLPEGALTLDFKRVLAEAFMGQVIARCDMSEDRLKEMTEDEIDGVIVSGVELEEIWADFDEEEFLSGLPETKGSTPKP